MQKNNYFAQKNGKIMELWLCGHQIIQGDESEDILGNGCYLMYPWVNRLSNKDIQSPFQDSNGYPLHGLYVNKERQIIKCTADHTSLKSLDVIEQISPFQESFTFTQQNQIKFEFAISDNQEFKYGIGYHPYFNFDNIDDIIMVTNLTKKLKVNEFLLPIGEYLEWEDIDMAEISLKNQQFDTCFTNQENKIYIKLIGNKYTLIIESDTLKYCQIYTPPDRKRIAIEPQSSTPDCFQYKTNIMGNCNVSFTVTLIQA